MTRALVAGLVLALLLAAPVAAKPNKTPRGQALQAELALTIDPATPAFGDSIVLTASGVPPFSFVHVHCYQDGAHVLDAWRGLNDTSTSYLDPLLLDNPPYWTSGAATCSADVLYHDNQFWPLFSTSFEVSE